VEVSGLPHCSDLESIPGYVTMLDMCEFVVFVNTRYAITQEAAGKRFDQKNPWISAPTERLRIPILSTSDSAVFSKAMCGKSFNSGLGNTDNA
jgi:hypothetical protein